MKRFTDQDIKYATMSEKYDGIQAKWDGRKLKTRTGGIIHAPKWWIADLPRKKLIGELFIGRSKFDQTRAVVMSKKAGDEWKRIKFMIFDGEFNGQYAKTINQTIVRSTEQLKKFYQKIISAGGEGIVITTKDGSKYKKKPISDDDGMFIGFGSDSVELKLRNGRIIAIKSAIKPKIGQIVKFAYEGLTSTGLPRFPRVIGIRAEVNLAF